ncbi:hypothetical protein [Streptomyces sp. SAJ15]|uniref:hypothetical protein n=1 Tax=Streptomyces sp. SAJ15 TaxID=2011095 RepID=UPI001643280B|nr:hypothetical protein [Streptomyces sp. SAJ15]
MEKKDVTAALAVHPHTTPDPPPPPHPHRHPGAPAPQSGPSAGAAPLAPPGPRRASAARPERRPVPWLAVVAVGYALVQLALVVPRTGHALGWDESVYVSQVDPRTPAAFFSAPRSRGISFLVAPVLAVTSSPLALRLFLMLLSTLALYAAFRVWRPLLGRTVTALAALLFAGLWITQVSGSAAMPNLWVALGAVAAVGWFLRVPDEPHARWWCAGFLGLVTLVRTPDAGWLALPLLAWAFAAPAWRTARPALLVGLVAGALQWIVEAYARFGSVSGRLDVSGEVEGGMGLSFNIGNVLRSLNGPQLCRPCDAALRHPELTLWWLALPLLAAAAVALALGDRRRGRAAGAEPAREGAEAPRGGDGPRTYADRPAVILLPVACAAAVAVPYLFLISFSAPRFLLPVYALLALPVAALAVRLVRADDRPSRAVVILAAVIALHMAGQHVVLWHATGQTQAVTGRYLAGARELHRLGVAPPCLITGDRALPVAYHAGCASAQTAGNNRSVTVSTLLRRIESRSAAVLAGPERPQPPSYARDWVPYPLRGTDWIAYLPPDQPGQPNEPDQSRQWLSGIAGTLAP